jgi:hypothetical protein
MRGYAPFGTPARSAHSHSANAENGGAVAGFSTNVQPVASAGPDALPPNRAESCGREP